MIILLESEEDLAKFFDKFEGSIAQTQSSRSSYKHDTKWQQYSKVNSPTTFQTPFRTL